MQFLFSNFPPVKTSYPTFYNTFYNLIPKATTLDIAVGYVTKDSLFDLRTLLEYNTNIKTLNLIVGMHFFEKFSENEYKAALDLNDYLLKSGRGELRLVNTFKYHGKLYSYSNADGAFAGIIGSDNLSSITGGGIRVYQSSLLIDEKPKAIEMNNFIKKLTKSASKNISDLNISDFRERPNPSFHGIENVTKIDRRKLISITSKLTSDCFEIPLKECPKSNLNCCFGKGRENKSTHLVKIRHWYEVELIVPKEITTKDNYPKPYGDFTVITDDGWSFACQVNGDYAKNFRSSGDLTILGRWIKGRLEEKGVLETGQPVTDDILKKYGRNTITLTRTSIPNQWYIDFGV